MKHQLAQSAVSESGWINDQLFFSWFSDLFLPNAPSIRPIILFVDGHYSHLSADLLSLAVKERVEIMCLPSHSSHLVQSLDKCFLKVFNVSVDNEINKRLDKDPNFALNRKQFFDIFTPAWLNAAAPVNILKGLNDLV